MNWEIIPFFSLTASLTVGVPAYIFFRNRMVSSTPTPRSFSRRRVIKVTLANILLNSFVGMHLLVLFLATIFNQPLGNISQVLASLLFLLVSGMTFYGNGIYITSIVLEAFTLPQLRRFKEFKTQFIATHLFHGPISHVLIYSGWPIALLTIALLNAANPHSQIIYSFLIYATLLFCSLISGVGFAIGQIYNKTFPYQYISVLFCLTVLSYTLIIKNINLFSSPTYIFLFGFCLSTILVLSPYILWYLHKHGQIHWDISSEQI